MLLELIVCLYVVVWGIMHGVRNTYIRIIATMTNVRLNQSEMGTILDLVWYMGIGYLVYLEFFLR